MFTPILVLFAGDAAVTRRIAEEIAATLREEGLATEMRPLAAVRDLAGFGTVVLGAPFEAGRWAAEARAFLSAQKSALIQLPVAVFANATPGEPRAAVENDREELLNELAQIRWLHPIAAGMFRTAVPTRHGVATLQQPRDLAERLGGARFEGDQDMGAARRPCLEPGATAIGGRDFG